MAGLWSEFTSYLWSEKFWFPLNYTWDCLENKDDGIYHPQRTDLLAAFPVVLGLFILRRLFERYVAAPIGRYYGIKETRSRSITPNPVLEKSFKISRWPTHDIIQGLSKQTDLSTRQVERWFRIRRNQDRASLMKKFTEGSWRFLYYFFIFYAGVWILWDKPWFSDVSLCWKGWPHQHVPNDIYWYYMLEMGFYWSLMFSQFMDVKRKDFWEMFIHHVATLALLILSWCNNTVRVGSLILCLHDAVDYLLEIGKLFKYLRKETLCNICFVLFVIVWFITRLYIYPFWIINSTMFESPVAIGMGPIYYTYNIFLVVLQILHIFWFGLILKVAYSGITNGSVERDVRSETEEDVSEDDLSETANGPKQKAG